MEIIINNQRKDKKDREYFDITFKDIQVSQEFNEEKISTEVIKKIKQHQQLVINTNAEAQKAQEAKAKMLKEKEKAKESQTKE